MKKLIFLLGALSLFLQKDFTSNYDKSKISVVSGSGTEYKISREEAEEELHKLAKYSYLEDAWMYHNGRLTDIGMKEENYSANIDLKKVFSTKYKPDDTLYIYHIHPARKRAIKSNPPSPIDYIHDDGVRGFVNLKDSQIILKAFDGIGKWGYNSNRALIFNPNFNYTNPYRDINLDVYLNNAYHSCFKEKRTKPEEIEEFITIIEGHGFKLDYEKMK